MQVLKACRAMLQRVESKFDLKGSLLCSLAVVCQPHPLNDSTDMVGTREILEESLAAALGRRSLVETHHLARVVGQLELAVDEAVHDLLLRAELDLRLVELVGGNHVPRRPGGCVELVRGGPVVRRVLDHDLKDPLCDRRCCRSLGATGSA